MWKFFLNQPRVTFLLILLTTVWGIYCMFALPKESSPEVKVPYASVTTFYAGASPLDVEDSITNPLEDVVLGVDQIKQVDSTSSEGFSMIFIEFETNADIQDRVQALQEAVNRARTSLPAGASTPDVKEINFNDQAVLSFALTSDKPLIELSGIAEDVQSDLEEVAGVSRIEISGAIQEQVQIQISPTALAHYQVDLNELMSALQKLDPSLPLGSVEGQFQNYSLRFSGSSTLNDLDQLLIRYQNGVPIFLRDVADIQLAVPEQNSISRVGLAGQEPQKAITFSVYKKTGADVVRMVDAINAYLTSEQTGLLEGVSHSIVFDAAQDVRDQLSSLGNEGLQTAGLIGVTLLLLGARIAIIAALSIPLTFFLTFIGLYYSGNSFNFLSLFALILAVGVLVDTGVVVVEAMAEELKKNADPRAAALHAIQEFQSPLIFGTLVTIAGFLPMLFMTGIIGEFIKHIPRTLTFTLLASLVTGLIFIPFLGTLVLTKDSAPKDSRVILWMRDQYEPLLKSALKSRGTQNLWLFGIFVAFLLSFIFPVTGLLKVDMFPASDYPIFFVSVENAKGTPFENTADLATRVEAKIQEIPDMDSYLMTVGQSNSLNGDLGAVSLTQSHLANFTVRLKKDRMQSSLITVDELREALNPGEFPGVTVQGVSEGPPQGAAISFRLKGSELGPLSEGSDLALKTLSEISGVVNAKSSLDSAVSELALTLKEPWATRSGQSYDRLSFLIRSFLSGLPLGSKISIDDEEYPALLSFTDRSLDDLSALPVTGPTGVLKVSDLLSFKLVNSPTEILHRDGDRIVEISADVATDVVSADVLAEFQQNFKTPDGLILETGGEAESMMESFVSLGKAMVGGFFLILLILVIQFNSFRESLIILLTIPLALIGIFPGMALVGMPFSFPAFIGLVALGGVVVNNGIILIERIKHYRDLNMDAHDAMIAASIERFQPILLTSLTTIIGIIPLALNASGGWAPLGTAIFFGALFSNVLTMIVIPVAYVRFARK